MRGCADGMRTERFRISVTPADAGIRKTIWFLRLLLLDSDFRGNDRGVIKEMSLRIVRNHIFLNDYSKNHLTQVGLC